MYCKRASQCRQRKCRVIKQFQLSSDREKLPTRPIRRVKEARCRLVEIIVDNSISCSRHQAEDVRGSEMDEASYHMDVQGVKPDRSKQMVIWRCLVGSV